jgi:hypothetical protein
LGPALSTTVAKLTKKVVDAAQIREKDYVIWDDELPGFGLRVFASGKRSYVIQYRSVGRSRRYTIGLHGVWTPETARQEAKIQFGRVAKGENPAEERQFDHKAITVKNCAPFISMTRMRVSSSGKADVPRSHRRLSPTLVASSVTSFPSLERGESKTCRRPTSTRS